MPTLARLLHLAFALAPALALGHLAMGQEPPPVAAPAEGEAGRAAPRTVFVAGASVSAGYGLSAELKTEADVPLSVFLTATLTPEGGERLRFMGEGRRWFSFDPYESGAVQVDAALAAKADVFVGVDFLFWYAFGATSGRTPRRAAGLEAGLKQLERLSGPVIIGDLPDIEHALEGRGPFGAPMVQRRMLPSEEERASMNRRIRAWAMEREHVRVFPLADVVGRQVRGEVIQVRDLEWDPETPGEGLQRDLLHPNSRGTTWVAMAVADALTQVPGLEATDFSLDERTIRKKVEALTAASRERRAASERRKAERKAQRDRRARERDGQEGASQPPPAA